MDEEKAGGAQLMDIPGQCARQLSCAPWQSLLPAMGVNPGGRKCSF